MYQLNPIPTIYYLKFVTIIPDIRYILVYKTSSQKIMLVLRDTCNDKIHGNQIWSFSQIVHPDLKSEKSVINSGTSTDCQYVDLVIT